MPETDQNLSVLQYYKQKVDSLQQQRLAWLSKLDECASRLSQKQKKHKKLQQLKSSHGQADFNIIHHSIAKFDEQLSGIQMDRKNQNLEFQEAEQLVRISELGEQIPILGERNLPCVAQGGLIDNQLNLHHTGWKGFEENGMYGTNGVNGTKGGNAGNIGNGTRSAGNFKNGGKNMDSRFNSRNQGHGHSHKQSSQGFQSGQGGSYYKNTNSINSKADFQSSNKSSNKKKTLEQIMKMQIIETKKLNDKQIAVMQQQQKALEQQIQKIKQYRQEKNKKQKNIIKQFEKKYNQLQKKYKELAESYFTLRREHKKKGNSSLDQNQKLKKIYKGFEQKITQAMRIYQKENKAKQTLIIKKSEDFQEDYKAKMRAKERNLQALKENYQKMQQLCIDKVRKLEATVEKAKFDLQDVEERRKFVVEQLRQQLKQLQKRYNEQRIQKAKIDLKLKQQMLQQKQRQQIQKQQQQKAQRALERQQMLKSAYKKTSLPQKARGLSKQKSPGSPSPLEKSNQKSRKKFSGGSPSGGPGSGKKSQQKQNKKKLNNAQSSSQQDGDGDSIQMQHLDVIRKQIQELDRKIAKQSQEP